MNQQEKGSYCQRNTNSSNVNYSLNTDMEDYKNSILANEQIDPQLGGKPIKGEIPLQIKEINNNWKKKLKFSIFERFLNLFMRPKSQKTPRKVFISGYVIPPNAQRNIIKNTKYDIFTFVPLVLFNQFKYFFNLFFLFIALTQFFKPLKIGYLFTYITPLALVLTLTMLKEAYDDIKRYKRDKEANQTIYNKISVQGNIVQIPSSDIKVGDIIQVNSNQRIPADLLLLNSSTESGVVFIRTDQLDGETDWKLRKSIKLIQDSMGHEQELKKLQIFQDLKAYVKIREPIENIYDFAGVFKFKHENQQKKKESLSLENTLWTNTVLASGRIYGLVIYCGYETRMQMNSRNPRTKFGQTDIQINFLSKLLFFLMIGLAAVIMLIRPSQPISFELFVEFFRFVILLSAIIPISLRVNLDFSKLMYSYRINIDKEINGTIARNSVIPEELGRIQYLLSDKTGTLTQNQMIFKRLSTDHVNYTQEDMPAIVQILKEQSAEHKGPVPDKEFIFQQMSLINNKNKKGGFVIKRKNEIVLRDLITALAVCNNVTPIFGENGEKEYQASSPDEISLVNLASELGIELIKREQNLIQIQNSNGDFEQYEILKIFPFNSETKRMGIVVRYISQNLYIYYLKGADSVMKQFFPDIQKGFIDEECEDLARQGLRTLVISQKILKEEDYHHWAKLYKDADEKLFDRQKFVQAALAKLENNMQFLGITGVEDLLQQNVSQSLEAIRNAGIKIWMLTGDKIETALCIAISSGLKAQAHQTYILKEVNDTFELQAKLTQFNLMAQSTVLVIDGSTLAIALAECENQFLEAACKSPSVLCCRCSPTQKSQIVEKIKLHTKKITCAIGDGGNDVGMILSADVGIGIVGKEGKQAALSADYSILQFDSLNKLLLWHGRLSYKRTALLTQFIYHRGLIITIMEMVFICSFHFVSFQFFNSKLLLGFSTIFTMLPVFALIFDEDVDVKTALIYPPLYQSLQKGRELNPKTYLGWFMRAIYSGTMIMILSILLFEKESFLNLQTIAFSALIVTEYLMTLSELHRLHIVTILSTLLSFGIYLVIWFLFPAFFDLANFKTLDFLWKMVVIIICSWTPIIIFQFLRKTLDPTDYETIVKNVKRQRIITKILD